METNKHYLLVGSFVLFTFAAIVAFSIWLADGYNSNKYTPYRIHFTESVNGLNVGSPSEIPRRTSRKGGIDGYSSNRHKPYPG